MAFWAKLISGLKTLLSHLCEALDLETYSVVSVLLLKQGILLFLLQWIISVRSENLFMCYKFFCFLEDPRSRRLCWWRFGLNVLTLISLSPLSAAPVPSIPSLFLLRMCMFPRLSLIFQYSPPSYGDVFLSADWNEFTSCLNALWLELRTCQPSPRVCSLHLFHPAAAKGFPDLVSGRSILNWPRVQEDLCRDRGRFWSAI